MGASAWRPGWRPSTAGAPGTTSCCRGAASVEVAYFGLLRDFHGAGLGGALLTHALRRALELGTPVTLHTCTLDGPHALANYLARGMRPVRSEVIGSA